MQLKSFMMLKPGCQPRVPEVAAALQLRATETRWGR